LKRWFLFLVIFSFLFVLPGCQNKDDGTVNRFYKGYVKNGDGAKVDVTINFMGKESTDGQDKVLKANKLTIKGDNFTKDIEFKSYNGEKTSKNWVFITDSLSESYSYGVVLLSTDYKHINGQIPSNESTLTFYSEDEN